MPDQPFESLTRLPDVSFRFRDVEPPSTVYIRAEEGLVLNVWSSQNTIRVNVTGRILLASGRIQPFLFQFLPDNTRFLLNFFMQLPEGFLLGVRVDRQGNTLQRGQTFVSVDVAQGSSATQFTGDTMLCQGWVSGTDEVAWPNGPNEPAFSGRGNLRTIVGTDPAAGVEISETVPSNAIWRLVAVRFDLVTDATVATRTVRLLLDDGANIFSAIPPQAGQAASLNNSYNFAATFPQSAVVGTQFLLPLPADLYMDPGYRFRTQTLSLQAGDNFSAPTYLVEEWFTQ